MLLLLATIRQQIARGWSHYARILLEERHHQAGGVSQTGVWKYLNGPFFPFSKDTPEAKSGTWDWGEATRQITFFASEEYDQQGVMLFSRVPANFRVLCSMRDTTGIGVPHVNVLDTLPSEDLVWVMGPANGRVKKEKEYPAAPGTSWADKDYRYTHTCSSGSSCSSASCGSSCSS
jgi:hypothetical protein